MATMLEPVSQPFTHGPRQVADGSAARQRPDPDQGVFETLLVLDGRPVELDAHLARLHASLAELYPGNAPPPLDVPAGDGPSAIRITVAPAGDGRLGAQTEIRGAHFGGEISLHSLRVRGGLGPHKWADRSLLDEAQDELPADSLPLIVDEDDAVLEASRANVFALRDGALLTPPIDGRILPGVTRMRVLKIAAELGIDMRETGLSRADLLAADEVFLTGSVRGIERVKALDGTPVPTGGEVAARITTELRLAWAGAKTAL